MEHNALAPQVKHYPFDVQIFFEKAVLTSSVTPIPR